MLVLLISIAVMALFSAVAPGFTITYAARIETAILNATANLVDRYDRAKRKVMYFLAAFITIQACLLFSLYMGHYGISLVLLAVSIIMVWLMHQAINQLFKLVQTIPDGPITGRIKTFVDFGEPDLTVIAVTVYSLLFITLVIYPNYFYNGLGMIYILIAMFGVSWRIAFATEKPIAAKFITLMSLSILIFAGVNYIAPDYISKVVNARQADKASNGAQNAADAAGIKKTHQVMVDEALLWEVERYPFGQIKTDSNGFALIRPCNDLEGNQKFMKKGDLFRTVELEASTIDSGEMMVNIILPMEKKNPDDPDEKVRWNVSEEAICDFWINISDTSMNSKVSSSSDSGLETLPPSVSVSPDGKTATLYIPQNVSKGVKTIDPSMREFRVKKGDVFTVTPSGQAQARSDGPVTNSEGETSGYCDYGVDSKFTCNVGGLELGIGSNKKEDRVLIDGTTRIVAHTDGLLTLRTIDKLNGFKGGGGYSVKVEKLD